MKFATIVAIAVALTADVAAIRVREEDDDATQEDEAAVDATPTPGITFTQQGDGKICKEGQKASVHYTGSLVSDKSVFDSSIPRGSPISFEIGSFRVIKCWEQAIVQLHVGDKADINCPAELAYGHRSKPKIPADSDLNFAVEVVSCE